MELIITDTIQADQIEDGDQILVKGDTLEDVVVFDGEDNIIVSGFSNETGDRETYTLSPSDTVDVWSI